MYCIYKTNGYRQWVIDSAIKEVTFPILQLRTDVEDWFHLRKENKRLLTQNKNLLMLTFNHKRIADTIENIYYGDSLLFSYHVAKVIESTTNKHNNYIVLDKGSADGIRIDMGVISSEGVVGIIKEVSPNFSVALSLLHSQFSISAKIKTNNVSGILTWDGIHIQYAQMNNLTHLDNVNVSDTITTQHSLIFPPNYPIGIISSVHPETIGGYYRLNIKLLTPFEKLRNVYIIEQNYSDELNNLMERIYENE
jgi:rod shape-determining protein MreC